VLATAPLTKHVIEYKIRPKTATELLTKHRIEHETEIAQQTLLKIKLIFNSGNRSETAKPTVR
jgi:hypothetical protein